MTRPQESEQAMLSDAKLVTQLQAGNEASFETLFLRHYDRVYGVLYRLTGNRADAEDLAQQVFLKLYRSPKQLKTKGNDVNVVGWLYRVAVNTGYNALRSQKRRRKWYEKLLHIQAGSAPDPADIAAGYEAQAQVRQVLASLKPRDAKLLLLRHSGLSYKELAAALNLSPGSIGSLLTRAERAFAKEYRSVFPEKEQKNG